MLWLSLTLVACTTVDPGPDYERARAAIRAATGASDVHDPEGPLFADEELELVLADGLAVDEAARLALLNNRRLQAGFQALGVARADFVQAGLLENPSLSLGMLVPDAGGSVRWTADLVWSVAELWRMPARQALAQAGLEQQVLELSRHAAELVLSTRRTYWECVAAREARRLAQAEAELAQRALAGVRRQLEAGIASRTEFELVQGAALTAQLESQRSERGAAESVRHLAALLSLRRDLLEVALCDPLPPPAPRVPEREALVELGLVTRADLRAAARAIDVAQRNVDLERRSRYGVDLGVSAERPEGGGTSDLLVGPTAALELPLFDTHAARIRRAEHELAQRRREAEALAAEAAQAVRAALDRSTVAEVAATFAADELVPQATRTAELAARALELGDATVLTLLAAERAALQARRSALETRLEAALAWIELERSVGRPLTPDSVPGP